MATLDKIIELQKTGMSDTDISTQLQNEGVSPTEINDSLNQAKIKNAVAPPEAPSPGEEPMQEMTSSIMEQPAQPIAEAPVPAPQAYAPQAPEANYQQPAEGTQPQDNYYQQTPQAYPQQDYYTPQSGANTETIFEIAEQVVTEKLDIYKKKIGDVVSFENTIQDKVNDMDDRLKRIEDTIGKLQQAIIGKIGEFGESSAMIHKDLDNLHGTVSKLMNPLMDNYNELKKLAK
jgi:hypothetical protein